MVRKAGPDLRWSEKTYATSDGALTEAERASDVQLFSSHCGTILAQVGEPPRDGSQPLAFTLVRKEGLVERWGWEKLSGSGEAEEAVEEPSGGIEYVDSFDCVDPWTKQAYPDHVVDPYDEPYALEAALTMTREEVDKKWPPRLCRRCVMWNMVDYFQTLLWKPPSVSEGVCFCDNCFDKPETQEKIQTTLKEIYARKLAGETPHADPQMPIAMRYVLIIGELLTEDGLLTKRGRRLARTEST